MERDMYDTKKADMSKLWLVAVIAVLATALVIGGFWAWRSRQSPTDDGQAQSQYIISDVNKLYLAPSDETPTVAKIQDVSKLATEQPFYNKAQNGDYLVVYTQAKVALIYRQSVNKLVAVSPVANQAAPADK